MSTMEIIVWAIATVLALLFGTFHLGKSQGKGIAAAEAEKQHADETAKANVAAAERRAEVTKGASDVQENVKRIRQHADHPYRWKRSRKLQHRRCNRDEHNSPGVVMGGLAGKIRLLFRRAQRSGNEDSF